MPLMTNAETNTLDWQVEVCLDSSIQFQCPLSKHLSEPKSIFLTGATGFLGVHLLNELLKTHTADIYCLIRCDNIEEGRNRLKKTLEFYLLWQDTFSDRIIPVVGDLGKPLLGLSPVEFHELAGIIDIIYHNGAWVNSARPYSTLKAVNVLGTQEVIRLASLQQSKPIHFTSTLGFFLNKTHFLTEKITETDIPNIYALKGGYRQSKWVAEQLIMIAQSRGMVACIYRPARIIGHSKTGLNGNFQDFLCILLKACIQLKKIPNLKTQINIVPVDYISQAIVGLSQANFSGKTFHLLNPYPTEWELFFNSICSLGYSLEKISYDQFLAEIKHQSSQNPKNKLYSSLFLLLKISKLFSPNELKFDANWTLAQLLDRSITCAPVNEELLNLYFSNFQRIGYFPPQT